MIVVMTQVVQDDWIKWGRADYVILAWSTKGAQNHVVVVSPFLGPRMGWFYAIAHECG